jgi:hypothetical protein
MNMQGYFKKCCTEPKAIKKNGDHFFFKNFLLLATLFFSGCHFSRRSMLLSSQSSCPLSHIYVHPIPNLLGLEFFWQLQGYFSGSPDTACYHLFINLKEHHSGIGLNRDGSFFAKEYLHTIHYKMVTSSLHTYPRKIILEGNLTTENSFLSPHGVHWGIDEAEERTALLNIEQQAQELFFRISSFFSKNINNKKYILKSSSPSHTL